MDAKLFCQAIVKFISGLIMVGVLIFLPAGSFAYWQGWLLMGILFVPMFIAGLVMMKKSPAKEKINAIIDVMKGLPARRVMAGGMIGPVAAFLYCVGFFISLL